MAFPIDVTSGRNKRHLLSHHGSPNGGILAGDTTLDPETSVILVGADNSCGQPSAKALILYEGVGAQIYRTDLSGTIIVGATADGEYAVNVDRREPQLAVVDIWGTDNAFKALLVQLERLLRPRRRWAVATNLHLLLE